MTDDLIDRLQNPHFDDLQWPKSIFAEAADRIEALEAALRKIGEGDVCVSLMTHPAQCGRAYQARAALGEKKDGL